MQWAFVSCDKNPVACIGAKIQVSSGFTWRSPCRHVPSIDWGGGGSTTIYYTSLPIEYNISKIYNHLFPSLPNEGYGRHLKCCVVVPCGNWFGAMAHIAQNQTMSYGPQRITKSAQWPIAHDQFLCYGPQHGNRHRFLLNGFISCSSS
jgi:hypothetical protein